MSENIFIQKRQRQRGRPLLKTRSIIGLMVLCITAYGAFRIWVGNPNEALCGDNCDQMFSLGAWVLGFAMIFAAVIGAGAIVGILVALVRRRKSTSLFTDEPPANDKG